MPFDIELELVDISENENINDLNCGVPTINSYILNGTAYYEHMMKLTNTKLIKLNDKVVGYFALQFKTIRVEENGTLYPCICLKCICIDLNYQNIGIGTKVLNYVVKNSKITSDFVGCRCLLIDVLTTKIEWYKDRGFDFIEDDDKIDLEEPTVEMIIDFRDNQLIDDYFEIY